MGSHLVVLPSSRWLMSVVDSPGSPVVLMTVVVLNVQVRCEASCEVSLCPAGWCSLNGGVSYEACQSQQGDDLLIR